VPAIRRSIAPINRITSSNTTGVTITTKHG